MRIPLPLSTTIKPARPAVLLLTHASTGFHPWPARQALGPKKECVGETSFLGMPPVKRTDHIVRSNGRFNPSRALTHRSPRSIGSAPCPDSALSFAPMHAPTAVGSVQARRRPYGRVSRSCDAGHGTRVCLARWRERNERPAAKWLSRRRSISRQPVPFILGHLFKVSCGRRIASRRDRHSMGLQRHGIGEP